MIVDVAHASVPKEGEVFNGDRAVHRGGGPGERLFGVVDGLGHGREASAVSDAAAAYLESVSLALPLAEMMSGLHGALTGSRGAAATVCVLRGGTLEVCAVGNVEVRSTELRLPVVSSPGVLGARVAKFRVCEAEIDRPGRLVLMSDGVSSRVPLDDFRRLPPESACGAILGKHRRREDDATVLVVDFR